MAPKPADVLDREEAWATLQRVASSPRPALVFVVGRRRVGKSYLLSRWVRQANGLYFQATRRSESEQLASLCRQVGRRFEDPALLGGAVLPSWEALFAYLTGRIAEEPFLVVLDEFPYLTAAAPALTSVIQKFWDQEWQRTRLQLVLCGSYITSMMQLEQKDQPLHGRRTERLTLQPFSCRDAGRFVPAWDVRDKLVLYGTVGGLPGHLALVDPAQPLSDNVARLMLDPGGRLVDEAAHTLDAFVGDADVHYAILDAIASGERTWNGITKRVGRTGGSLSRPLHWLEQMQLVERVTPITVAQRRNTKRAYYRIRDPYVRFWHRVVAPLVRAGSVGLVSGEKLWTDVVRHQIDDNMGEVFEDVCRQHVARGAGPFQPLRVGTWWDARSRHEVDVAALSADHDLFVAECKWGAVRRRDMVGLQERSRRLAAELPRVRRTHLGLYTARPVTDRALRAAARNQEVSIYGLDDVLGDARGDSRPQ